MKLYNIYTHNNKIMNTLQVRRLIKEAIADRLAMIDEAGNKAAIQAKIAKIEEDIRETQDIKNSIPSSINQYVDSEIVGDLMDNLEDSIKELEAKKQELQEQLEEMEKPVKESKKKKPSAGMTKKEKSAVSKKAHAGGDIGKPGKGFEKVAKAAEKQYGSKEAGQRVAAASMWKNAAK
jgi:chromosome segregation ATPase